MEILIRAKKLSKEEMKPQERGDERPFYNGLRTSFRSWQERVGTLFEDDLAFGRRKAQPTEGALWQKSHRERENGEGLIQSVHAVNGASSWMKPRGKFILQWSAEPQLFHGAYCRLCWSNLGKCVSHHVIEWYMSITKRSMVVYATGFSRMPDLHAEADSLVLTVHTYTGFFTNCGSTPG